MYFLPLAFYSKDIQTIREHVSYWMLISRLHMETSEWDQAGRDLLKARQLQLKIVVKGTTGREGLNIAEEKKLTALLVVIFLNKI